MEYVKITSSDNIEFIIEIELAKDCRFFRKKIQQWI